MRTSNSLPRHQTTPNDYGSGITPNMTSSIDITNQRTAATVLCALLLLCAIYLLMTLSYFEHQMRQKEQEKSKRRKSSSNLTAGERLRILCLCSAAFALLRYVFDMVEILEIKFAFSPCAWVRHVKLLMLTGSAVCSYLVLWLRQRLFYNTPALKHLSNKITKICSFAAVIFMAASASVPVAIYLAISTYVRAEVGCLLVSNQVWEWIPGVLYYVLVLIFQFMLISLFIYPQWKHHKDQSSIVENKDLIPLIKRVGNAAIVAVTTTSASGLLSLALLELPYDEWLHLLVGLDILVNLLSVIFSFRDWKKRLAPFLVDANEVRREKKNAAQVRKKITSNDWKAFVQKKSRPTSS